MTYNIHWKSLSQHGYTKLKLVNDNNTPSWFDIPINKLYIKRQELQVLRKDVHFLFQENIWRKISRIRVCWIRVSTSCRRQIGDIWRAINRHVDNTTRQIDRRFIASKIPKYWTSNLSFLKITIAVPLQDYQSETYFIFNCSEILKYNSAIIFWQILSQ